MRTFVFAVVVLFCILMATPRAIAQESAASHAATVTAIDEALQQHVAGVEADRAAVQRVLERPDVRAVAAQIGVDMRRAQSAVATLQGDQLTELATRARQVEQQLAGGQGSVTISYTLIIIGLLVLILLILIL